MSEETHAAKDPSKSYKLASVSIAVIIVAYIVALCLGYPQKATQYIQEANGGHAEATVETPAVEEAVPTVEEAAPAVEEAVPAVEEAVPTVEEAAPAVEEAAPAVEEAAPAVEEAAPAVEEAAPAVEEAAPAVEEATTASESTSATEETGLDPHAGHNHAPGEACEHDHDHEGHHHHDGECCDDCHEHAHGTPVLPPYFMTIPFVLLLLAIAVLPLIPATEEWWESNLHRFYVAAFLGIITLIYYGFFHQGVLPSHWHGLSAEHFCEATSGARMWTIFANAIFDEFIPFIVLLFALFTIAGGIRVEGNLKAKPLTNTIFIAIGTFLASFIGTTGAAMLLIRPLLETNKERKHKVHTVIFFIFAVCNCGGCLLPTGDPPLFLGYLAGVGFTWTMCLWKEWLFTNVLLLIVYFLWDALIAYPRETGLDIAIDDVDAGKLKFLGLFPNVPLLVCVILAVALLDPSKAVPGTEWHAPMYLREIVQLSLVWISLVCGNTQVRLNNRFNFGAITEVAALFFGIFICMQVPLQILNEKGGELGMGVDNTKSFFWATGSLSSVLDNAPTYVVFSTVGKTATNDAARDGKIVTYAEEATPEVKAAAIQKADELKIEALSTEADCASKLLVAVSLGAVFMGAMTYIGNGPNFMVKAIAEEEGVKMPSFFGYMVYSIGIIFPILLAMTFIFL
ncbi:MAG: sodium:proton antiporter [Thermoguttaceae bacterium]|nr:sodium:proton antiporter [Thermoguttaceae bacterium]